MRMLAQLLAGKRGGPAQPALPAGEVRGSPVGQSFPARLRTPPDFRWCTIPGLPAAPSSYLQTVTG